MAAEAGAYSKDDAPHKAPDHVGKLLDEIDPVTVEVSCEEFEQFLPGDNFPDEDVNPADLELLNFPKDSKREHVRYDPLVSDPYCAVSSLNSNG